MGSKAIFYVGHCGWRRHQLIQHTLTSAFVSTCLYLCVIPVSTYGNACVKVVSLIRFVLHICLRFVVESHHTFSYNTIYKLVISWQDKRFVCISVLNFFIKRLQPLGDTMSKHASSTKYSFSRVLPRVVLSTVLIGSSVPKFSSAAGLDKTTAYAQGQSVSGGGISV